MSELVEGTRVRLTKDAPLWIGHMRMRDEGHEGPYTQTDQGPAIPKGVTGTIHHYEMYNVWHDRPEPTYIAKAKTPELRQRLLDLWKSRSGDPLEPPQYNVEHHIIKGTELPKGGVYAWSMWGVAFDGYPVSKGWIAGLGRLEEGLPDYLEVDDAG